VIDATAVARAAFASELDGVGVAQLVRREAAIRGTSAARIPVPFSVLHPPQTPPQSQRAAA
jgi:hypothetical protein